MSDSRIAAEWDWVTTARGYFLHAPAVWKERPDCEPHGIGTTACGIRNRRLFIPGVITRLGAERCRSCCRITGFPQGRGSPKNDKACRALVERRLRTLWSRT